MAQIVLPFQVVQERIERAQALMRKLHYDVMLLPVSAELEWLAGYQAHALERLTVLIVQQHGPPTLIAPELEVVTLEVPDDVFQVLKWSQGEDPFKLVVEWGFDCRTPEQDDRWIVAIGRKMPAMHLLPLQALLPNAAFIDTTEIISTMRRTKDATEIEALQEVARIVDLTIAEIQTGQIPLLGRTEREVAEAVKASILHNGHDSVSFCIVATGPNSADPHHEPDDTVIERGHVVLFDIGGRKNGYSSDITRCVTIGEVPARVHEAYLALREAQELAFQSIRPGVPANEVDGTARRRLAQDGLADLFIHSLGHGIGLDEHEDPFVTKVNVEGLRLGDTFSVEPGVYLKGDFGLRLEDIVTVIADGALRLNHAKRDLIQLAC